MSQPQPIKELLEQEFVCLDLRRKDLLTFLEGKLTAEEVAGLTDEEMQGLADRIGEQCFEVLVSEVRESVPEWLAERKAVATV